MMEFGMQLYKDKTMIANYLTLKLFIRTRRCNIQDGCRFIGM